MKQLLALLLALLLVFSMVACGATGGGKDKDKDKDQSASHIEDDEEEEEEEEEEAQDEDTDDGAFDIGDMFDEKLPTIKEQVIYDQDGVVVMVTEFGIDEYEDEYITFYAENNTDDDLAVNFNHCMVNGIMCETGAYLDVSAGGNATDSMFFYGNFQDFFIDVPQEVTVDMEIYNYNTGDYAEETQLLTFKTSAYGTAPIVYHDEGMAVYENDVCRIVFQSVEEDEYFSEFCVKVFIENKTDESIYVSLDNIGANGVDLGAWFSDFLLPGSVRYSEIYLDMEMLDAAGISAIESLTFDVEIIEYHEWETMVEEYEVNVAF